jgi:hypothetical protein
MKTTLTTSQAAHILIDDENASWSRAGAFALVEHLEQMEEECGQEIEFDYVAIRCDYSEHESLQEWASDYFGTPMDEWCERIGADMEEISEILADADKLAAAGEVADANQTREHADGILDSAIREYINDHGQLIEFDGGVIVSSF